jgi:purine catabolism regulator
MGRLDGGVRLERPLTVLVTWHSIQGSDRGRRAAAPEVRKDKSGMPLTVRQLAARADLGLRVVAGQAGLDRPISWVHSSEIGDPTPWLDAGALLLTTGMGHRAPGLLADLASRLAAIDAGGIGFAVGVAFDEVPAELREAADAVSISVLEVPYETPFVAISQAVAGRIAEERQATLQRALRAHRLLTRAALDQGAVRGVPPVLTQMLGGWAAIFDRDGKPLTVSPPAAAAEAESYVPEVRRALGRGVRSLALSEPSGQLVGHTLGVRGADHGHLIVHRDRALQAPEQTVVAAAASLVTYELEQARAAAARARHVDESILNELLRDGLDARSAARHVRSWGLDPTDLVVLAIIPDTGREQEHGMLDDVRAVLAAAGARAVAARDPRQRVLVLASGADAVCAALEDAAVPGWVGVGARTTAGELAPARRQAEQAARIGSQEHRRISRIDDFDGLSLLLAPDGDVAATVLVRRLLRPILDVEQDKGIPLIESLRVFLDHNGSWGEASVALGVHRHTLRARMDTVERVLGRSLDSAYLRLELSLALQAHSLATDST